MEQSAIQNQSILLLTNYLLLFVSNLYLLLFVIIYCCLHAINDLQATIWTDFVLPTILQTILKKSDYEVKKLIMMRKLEPSAVGAKSTKVGHVDN